jgi:hypothetical protein
MKMILTLALVAIPAWALWSLCRPRPAFVVRVEDGVPRVAHGKVAREFLHDVRETCGRHSVTWGEVRGVARDRKISLEFSVEIPEACRQQLRNLWVLTGRTEGRR